MKTDNSELMGKKCQKCGALPKLASNSMKMVKSNVLVLGESPVKVGLFQTEHFIMLMVSFKRTEKFWKNF
jgi:hypothetical protein